MKHNCTKELCDQHGMKRITVYKRIQRYGMTVEEALTKPLSTREERSSYAKNEVTINGQTKSIKEWLKENNINHNTFRTRRKAGKSIEECLTTPVVNRKTQPPPKQKLVTINSETHNLGEWCKIKGISRQTFYNRLKQHPDWTIEQLLNGSLQQ